MRGEFTKKFSEKYLSINVLNEIFNNGKRKIFTDESPEIVKLKGVAPSDYYIVDWSNIFIFEVKDTLLLEKNRLNYEYNEFEKDLKSKVCSEKKNGKERKGVYQLVNSIIELPQYDFYQKLKSKNNIYPILLLHDEVFNCAGMNYMLSKWFLETLQEKGVKNSRIKPLLVITIDTLIIYNSYFKKNTRYFKNYIDMYFQENLLVAKSEKHMTPFNEFLRKRIQFPKIDEREFALALSDLTCYDL